MKVGVLMNTTVPTEGGGYTFQEDIFQALTEVESKHTFIVLSMLKMDETRKLESRGLKVLSVHRDAVEKTLYFTKKYTIQLAKKLPILKKHLQFKSWLTQLAYHHGIEVMWFPTPGFFEVDVPYIYTVFDLQHRVQPWFPEVCSNGQWEKREKLFSKAISRAAVIITGAEAGRDEIERFYRVPKDRIKLLPHPTPHFTLNSIKNSTKDTLLKYNIPQSYLFYPAQFWPHKNHIGLLYAVKHLREKYSINIPAVFVGSDKGNLRHIRLKINELGLTSQIHILGFVPSDDLVGLYRHAFALIYPTYFGPENLPPLEAFSLGCPVIASNVPGAQEQLGDAALLVDPKNSDSIALAVKSLYDNPELKRTIIQRGAKRATDWTGKDFVKGICQIIDDMEPIRRCWSNVENY